MSKQFSIWYRLSCFFGQHFLPPDFIYNWIAAGKPDHYDYVCHVCGKEVKREKV